jgi:hypothetical protein
MFLDPVVNLFKQQTFPTVYSKYFFMNNLCIKSFCSKEMHNRTLLFGSKLLKNGRHFDYWNQPLNMRMRVCYLHRREAGLCCYLVIHTENLLRPLQLLYFHLWRVYWLSFIDSYLGGTGFQSRSVQQLSTLTSFVCLSLSRGKCQDIA